MKSEVQTARRALLEAFSRLALRRRYQDFGVGIIAAEAGVARSTFYYHFRAKDDLLLQNLKPMMAALACLPASTGPTQEVEYWVAHIWEHRATSRRLFDGSTGRKITDAMIVKLQTALRSGMPDPGEYDAVALLAVQITGSMLSLLRAWIDGRASAAPSDVARMLWSGARALVDVNSDTVRAR